MDLSSPSSFFRRFVARQAPADPDDPADLGTAFGLDASLGPVSAYVTGEAVAGDDDADQAPMSWLARRLRRPAR